MLGLSNEPKFSLIGSCVQKLCDFEYQNLGFSGRDKIVQNSPKRAYISNTMNKKWEKISKIPKSKNAISK